MNDSLKWLDDLGDVFTSLLNTDRDLETADMDSVYCLDPMTWWDPATDISDLSNQSVINTEKRKPIQNPLITAEHQINAEVKCEMSQRGPPVKKQKLTSFGSSGTEQDAVGAIACTGQLGY